MPKRKVYRIIIAALIYLVLIFNILGGIKQLTKLLLVYKKMQKELNLKDYKVYTIDRRDLNILNSKKENFIDISFL